MQAYAINLSAAQHPYGRPGRAQRRVRTLRVLMLLLVALLVFVFAPRIVQTASRTAVPDTVSHVVGQGETLWEIASSHSQGEDVRRVITRIKRFNGMESGTVYPGQTLAIPLGSRR